MKTQFKTLFKRSESNGLFFNKNIRKSIRTITPVFLTLALLTSMLVVPISSANTASSKGPKIKSHDAAAIQQKRKNRITAAQREAAAKRSAAERQKKQGKPVKSSAKNIAPSVKLGVAAPQTSAAVKLAAMPAPGGTPNYFGPEPNWAYSPILRKFVDTLPGLPLA
ncbi:hypothetical protein HGA34_02495 [Candidatus Falkowbacteria bacterium]|nr:hypothetical protein [Candidatus Falkowbacteria bacterium]